MDLTVKQWKALSFAYPLYGKAASGPEDEDDGEDSGELPTGFAEFVDVGVPRLEAAFEPQLTSASAGRRVGGGVSNGTIHPLRPPWRHAIPAAVDRLLAYLFSLDSGEGTTIQADPTSTPSATHGGLRPLIFTEVQLLYLYHKERTKCEAVQLAFDTYRESAEREVRAAATATITGTTPTLPPPATHAATADGRARPAHAPAAGERGRAEEREGPRAMESPRPSVSSAHGADAESRSPPGAAGRRTALPPPAQQRGGEAAAWVGAMPPAPPVAAPTASIEVVCEECGEVGGELFRCRRCGSIRHEACGGPHPVSNLTGSTARMAASLAHGGGALERVCVGADVGAVGQDGLEGLCRACRKDINIFSSSSSSLHSSTSSEERREIDAYFGTSEDSDDSDSFLVRTSEDSDASSEGRGPTESETGDSHSLSHLSASTVSDTLPTAATEREGLGDGHGSGKGRRKRARVTPSTHGGLPPRVTGAGARGVPRRRPRARSSSSSSSASRPASVASDDEELALLGLQGTRWAGAAASGVDSVRSDQRVAPPSAGAVRCGGVRRTRRDTPSSSLTSSPPSTRSSDTV